MWQGSEPSEAEQVQIWARHFANFSNRSIATHIDQNSSAVDDLVKIHDPYGLCERSARSGKLSSQDERRLGLTVLNTMVHTIGVRANYRLLSIERL